MQRESRRLAAIVAADIAGYARLVDGDEEGTLQSLRAHRHELIDPAIEHHGGRIANTAGDSMLLEFASAVDAVRAMLAIQLGMADRNQGIDEDRQIRFRIGVNVGDVVAQGGDLLGEGVNIAARLEGLAAPGGICLSATAFDYVDGKVDAPFADGGMHTVKNIARPVHVWHWSPTATDAPPRAKAEAAAARELPSIAVLPFNNMSSDPEDEFFADGIAEDIITALSKISRMRVIARNSTFAYKGQAIDLRRVARELGVRYVLEGSIRRGGNRLRITAQLIDATDGSHLWAERFDRTVDDLFDIQDEITKEIVTALRVKLTDGEEARLWARGTNDIEAWQCCIRATELFMRFNSVDYLEARALAEQAIARDPEYAYAWATLGFTHWWDGRLGYTGDTAAKFARAKECADRAMALDDTVSWSIGLSAMAAGTLDSHDEAVAIARRGIELYPGSADVRAFLAFALLHASQFAESVEHYRAAMALNPFYPDWYRSGLARALIVLGELDEALALSDEILATDPVFLQAWLNRAFIYGETGRAADARQAVLEIRRLAPNLRVGHVLGVTLINDAATGERFVTGLRAAGLPDD